MSDLIVYPSPKMQHNQSVTQFQTHLGTLSLGCYHSPIKKDRDNEDAVIVINKEQVCLLGVFDGLGGHSKGKEASHIICKNLHKLLSRIKDPKKFHSRILEAIEKSHDEIQKMSKDSGTTLVLAEIFRNKIRLYSIGDSFAALYDQKANEIFRMTEQSPLGYARESGLVAMENINEQNVGHILHFALGLEPYVLQVSSEIEFTNQHILVLGSDGFFDHGEKSLDSIIKNKTFDQSNIDKLRDDILENMQQDNHPDDFSFLIQQLDYSK